MGLWNVIPTARVAAWAPSRAAIATFLSPASRFAFDAGRYQVSFRGASAYPETHSMHSVRIAEAWARGYEKHGPVLEAAALHATDPGHVADVLRAANRERRQSAATYAIGSNIAFERRLAELAPLHHVRSDALLIDQLFGVTLEQIDRAAECVTDLSGYVQNLATAHDWFESGGEGSFPDHAALATYADHGPGTPGLWEAEFLQAAGDLPTAVMYARAGVCTASDVGRALECNAPAEYAGNAS